MTERGGPTTQSGILFQNSVTSLCFGRMLDPTARPASQTIVCVRAEAPTSVDDTVVTFQDRHREFIQSKEAITEKAWQELWSDVAAELSSTSFNRDLDRIVLVFGESPPRVAHLRGAAERALGSTDISEWYERLTAAQGAVVREVAALTGFAERSPDLFTLFRILKVQFFTREAIEHDLVPHWIPASTLSMTTLFRLLRDRVGGDARIRAELRPADLLTWLADENPAFRLTAVSDADIARAATSSSAPLTNYRGTFGDTGQHLARPVVQQLREWLCSTESEGTIAMLLDEAGAGKSVVMGDLLHLLATDAVSTLAMKADLQLSAVKSADDIQQRLQLPDSVERVVERLSHTGPVVVIVDQIDALSLTLAHDARTLDTVLDLVARLTLIPQTRLLISCRTFDRSNDARLRKLETKKEFRSTELTDAEITQVLNHAGIELAALTENTRKLLRLPLHLDLYLLASAGRGEHPATLQDLYAALLRNVAFRNGSALPPLAARAAALKELTVAMYERQRTSVPATFFVERGGDALHVAATWLASEGILLQTDTGWAFRHQTLFDYLFARDFVDSGRSLIEHLRATSQGLDSRTALIQVLSYQRGTDAARYLTELDSIWRAQDIRFHLRQLLMRWFGTLPDPTPDEVRWARRLLTNGETSRHFLTAARGNAAWFRALIPELQALLQSDDDAVMAVLRFFIHVTAPCQRELVSIMRPYITQGEEWRERCRVLLSYFREWRDPSAIEFFDELIQAGAVLPEHFMDFKDMARLDAHRTAAAVLRLLNRQLDLIAAAGTSGSTDVIHSLRIFEQTDLDEALDIVADNAPVTWLDGAISWLERALSFSSLGYENGHTFQNDSLAIWSNNFQDDIEMNLQRSVLRALIVLGEQDAAEFHRLISRLERIHFLTAQIVAAQAYTNLARRYPAEACNFLLGDPRRLWLGSGSAIHTRRLIAAVFPDVSQTMRHSIETAIAQHIAFEFDDPTRARQLAGLEHFYLLSAIPHDFISADSRRRYQELLRKFPEVNISLEDDGFGIQVLAEHSPIEPPRAQKMRDDDWLRAMRKYSDPEPAWQDLASPRALAELLKEEAKKDPQRFAALAGRLPDDVQDLYIDDLIDGLAESEITFAAVVNLIRRFATQPNRNLVRTTARAMRKRPRDVPSDIVELLESWVRDEALDDQHSLATLDYLNTRRGSAFLALCHALRTQGGESGTARRWALYEYVATSGTNALRAAVIEQLLYDLHGQRNDALDMFERVMHGHVPTLFDAHHLPRFLHAAIWKTFGRVQPTIFDLVASEKENHRELGSKLIVIAAITPSALSNDELALVRGVVTALLERDLPHHKPAMTRILAHNVDDREADYCFEQLSRLFPDPDARVRAGIAEVFGRMTATHLLARREWLTAYAESPSLPSGIREFAEYLLNHGASHVETALDLIHMALANDHPDEQRHWFDGRDFIRFVLSVDNDPTIAPALKRRAMDVFDQLMEQYGTLAESMLTEWDRR